MLTACRSYENDERKSVQQYLSRCRRQVQKDARELERVRELQRFEQELAKGAVFCGIDEAGRGPLAGPVVAAAVIMPGAPVLMDINDSKQVSEKKREELYDRIMEAAVSVGVGIVSETVIDEINILQATYQAMREAVSALKPVPGLLINDAVRIPGLPMAQIPVIKGDAKCYSIAAASIIAKVTRDRLMKEYDKQYPEYGFAQNKGYGSEEHIRTLRTIGPCAIHRRSFITHFTGNETES